MVSKPFFVQRRMHTRILQQLPHHVNNSYGEIWFRFYGSGYAVAARYSSAVSVMSAACCLYAPTATAFRRAISRIASSLATRITNPAGSKPTSSVSRTCMGGAGFTIPIRRRLGLPEGVRGPGTCLLIRAPDLTVCGRRDRCDL